MVWKKYDAKPKKLLDLDCETMRRKALRKVLPYISVLIQQSLS